MKEGREKLSPHTKFERVGESDDATIASTCAGIQGESSDFFEESRENGVLEKLE
jgi:hypothetical protein